MLIVISRYGAVGPPHRPTPTATNLIEINKMMIVVGAKGRERTEFIFSLLSHFPVYLKNGCDVFLGKFGCKFRPVITLEIG